MEKSNLKIKVVIGVMVSLIVVLLGIILYLLFGKSPVDSASPAKPENPEQITSITPSQKEEIPGETAGKNESGTSVEKVDITPGTSINTGEARNLVKDGFEFMIPNDYGVIFSDEIGIVVYMSDIFQVKLAVIAEDEDTFASYREEPSVLTKKAIAAGAQILQECRLQEVNGLEVFCFKMELSGDTCAVFRTRLDEEHSLAGQMVLQSKDITEKDYLQIFAGIAQTAQKTDKADTTSEEFRHAEVKIDVGSIREQATIDTGKFKVTYKVPVGFFCTMEETYKDEYLDYFSDSYMTDNYDMIDIVVSNYEGGAKTCVEQDLSLGGCDIKEMEVEGHLFYAVESMENDGEKTTQKILIASDINADDWVYAVRLFSSNPEEPLTVEDLQDFLIYTVQ